MCFHPYFQNHLVPSQTGGQSSKKTPVGSPWPLGQQAHGVPKSRANIPRGPANKLLRRVGFSPYWTMVWKEELASPKKLRWLKFKKGLEIIAFRFAHGKKETCSKERWWFFKIGGNPWNLPLMVSFNGTFGARVLFEDQLKFPNSVWSWIIGCMLDFT